MKTRIQDSEAFVAPDAEGSIATGEVKTEITFFWSDADEWKPAREASEFMENMKSPPISDPKS